MNNSLLVTVQSDHNDHTYVSHQIAEFLAYRGYTNVNLFATHSIDEVETMLRVSGNPIEHPQRGDAMWLGHDRHIVVAMDEPRTNNENRKMHHIPIRDLTPEWLPAVPTHEFDDPNFGKEKPSKDDLEQFQSLINLLGLANVMEFVKNAVIHKTMAWQAIFDSREAAKRSFFATGADDGAAVDRTVSEAAPQRTSVEGGFFTGLVPNDGKISDEGMEMLAKSSDTSALHADLEGDQLNGDAPVILNREPFLQPTSSAAFFGGGKITSDHGGRGKAVPIYPDEVTEKKDEIATALKELYPEASHEAIDLFVFGGPVPADTGKHYGVLSSLTNTDSDVSRPVRAAPDRSRGEQDSSWTHLHRPSLLDEAGDPGISLSIEKAHELGINTGSGPTDPMENDPDKLDPWALDLSVAQKVIIAKRCMLDPTYYFQRVAKLQENKYGSHAVVIHMQPGEPFFVLLGRDPQSPDLVDQWATDRNQMEMGNPKVAQAMDIAMLMRQFKEANPELGASKNLYEEKLCQDLMYLIPRTKPYTEDEILKMAMVVAEAAALSEVELNIQRNTCFTHMGVQNQVDQQIGQVTKIAAAANVEVFVLKVVNHEIGEIWGDETRFCQLMGLKELPSTTFYRPGEYPDMDEQDAIEIPGLNVMNRNLDEFPDRDPD